MWKLEQQAGRWDGNTTPGSAVPRKPSKQISHPGSNIFPPSLSFERGWGEGGGHQCAALKQTGQGGSRQTGWRAAREGCGFDFQPNTSQHHRSR